MEDTSHPMTLCWDGPVFQLKSSKYIPSNMHEHSSMILHMPRLTSPRLVKPEVNDKAMLAENHAAMYITSTYDVHTYTHIHIHWRHMHMYDRL